MNPAWLRRLISTFLVFHLIGVIIGPNPASYLTQSLSFIYRPYLNFLGLAHTWGFFAPEPVSPPMYIEYAADPKGEPPLRGRFPDEKSPFFFRDRQNRRMTMSRFILAYDDNVRNMFVRYLCLRHPTMEELKLWRVVATQPSLIMVRSGEKRITDPAEHKIEVLGTYYCPEGP
jgi:hypothetical protein